MSATICTVCEDVWQLSCADHPLVVDERHSEDAAAAYQKGYHTGRRHELRMYKQREAHVIGVLREAQANNGGYGFVLQLLEYLGATSGE